MAMIKVFEEGVTASFPPANSSRNHQSEGKKEQREGWSDYSTRSNTQFLYSVRGDDLTGYGYALTLTLRDCPPTSDSWAKLRHRFSTVVLKKELGATRFHWVVEWQRRGVPHLHASVYFPELMELKHFRALYRTYMQDAGARVRKSHLKEVYDRVTNLKGWGAIYDRYIRDYLRYRWCQLAKEYGAREQAQFITPIEDSVAWSKYQSKHGSRGQYNYQRSSLAIPAGWKKTGRVWGQWGDWPRTEPIILELQPESMYRYRRIMKRWRIADARTPSWGGDIKPKRIKAAKRCLNSPKASILGVVYSHDERSIQSRTRGLSEWCSRSEQLRLLAWIQAQGHDVTEVYKD